MNPGPGRVIPALCTRAAGAESQCRLSGCWLPVCPAAHRAGPVSRLLNTTRAPTLLPGPWSRGPGGPARRRQLMAVVTSNIADGLAV